MPIQGGQGVFFIAVINIMIKSKLWRQRLISAYNSGNMPSLKELRAETQIKNPEAGIEAELWMRGVYWLFCMDWFLH